MTTLSHLHPIAAQGRGEEAGPTDAGRTAPHTEHTTPAARDTPLPEGAAQQLSEADLSSASILVVDDNEQNLELLQAYLEQLGSTIETARDGVEAIAAVERSQPDLILLDVMMPRMSGFQVCSKVKSDPATRDIPVVMVTALNEVGDIERAVECGADDFLTKPVHKLELVTRVRSLLRVRLLKKQLEVTLREMKRLTGAGDEAEGE